MWIPVIIVAWAMSGPPIWVNFPMVNFPFSTKEDCQQYITSVRSQIVKSDKYVSGWSICIEVPQGTNT